MKCTVCGNPLFAGRTVFSCSCGSITHAQCWEKHIVESHKPPFTTGTITIRGEFVPRSAETEQGSHPTEKEPIAAKWQF
jgi:peptide methionine sulfoxide reductase MsrB